MKNQVVQENNYLSNNTALRKNKNKKPTLSPVYNTQSSIIVSLQFPLDSPNRLNYLKESERHKSWIKKDV
jgi:hypothetical protein